jgi:hypothetical protein
MSLTTFNRRNGLAARVIDRRTAASFVLDIAYYDCAKGLNTPMARSRPALDVQCAWVS